MFLGSFSNSIFKFYFDKRDCVVDVKNDQEKDPKTSESGLFSLYIYIYIYMQREREGGDRVGELIELYLMFNYAFFHLR